MPKRAYLLAMTAAAALATPAHAQTVIDFSSMPVGPVMSPISGVGISLAGGPDATGPAVISNGYFDTVNSLLNSSNASPGSGNYPTATILAFDFSRAASGISFTFNNYGSDNGSFYTAFDAFNAVVSTAVIDDLGDGFNLVNVTGSGIRSLQLNNATNGANNWVFGVGQLSFTAAGVPEPTSWAMMIGGFGLVGGALRRRTAVRTAVRFA